MSPADDAEPFFDPALQHERTSLAWERTAIAIMVSGMLLARYAAQDTFAGLAVVGLLQTVFGAAVLVWSGRRYDDLHGPLHRGANISQATALRWIGFTTIAFAGTALALAVALTLSRSG